jgi:hypothetical protein
MKENRDRIISNLRNLHPCNDVDNLLSAIGTFESDIMYSEWSDGHRTEANALTKEGNTLYLDL